MSGIVLDGWYGKRNTGDDAFCIVGALRYARDMPCSGVAVLADARGVPDLPAGVRVAAYRTGVRGLQRACSLAHAARAGAVVHLGGSRFDRRTTTTMRDQATLARMGITRLHAQAVSVGPFAEPSHAAMQAEFLSQFTSISVRDEASLQRARDLGLNGVVRAFDVAVLLPDLAGVSERPQDHLARRHADGYPGGPVVGVALRDPDAYDHGDPRAAQRETRVISALRSLAARLPGLRVEVLCFGAADMRVSCRIAAELSAVCRTRVHRYAPRPAAMLRTIATCDLVLAMRLHAAIFSFALRVPFAMIDYHAKCRDFCCDVRSDPRLVYPASGPDPEQQEHLTEIFVDPERRYRPPGLSLASAQELADRSFREVHRHLGPCAEHGAHPRDRAPAAR